MSECALQRRKNIITEFITAIHLSKWPANDQQIGPVSQATDNQAVFNDGAYFSEVVGKKKDLFKALDISLPENEMGVSYEEDDKVGVDDEDYTNIEDLPV